MNRASSLLTGAGLLFTLLFPVALHATDEWKLLGTRRVGRAAEKDGIDVGLRDGRFTAIRIDVNEGTVDMYNVRVLFTDGEAFSPDTRLVFQEGERSRVIDLPGDARGIRRIEFAYRNRDARGQAVVSVYGREARGTSAGPGSAGWEVIGAREVSFRADHDVVEMPGSRAFRALMFQVEGGDLDMFNVKVTFANGESFSPDTRLHFDANSRSRTIDLPGTLRDIRRIDFYYRSVKGGGDGRATIRVFGRTGPAESEGWETIGARQVSFRADHDVVEMPGSRAYRSLMFQVEGGDLEMFNVKVTFANGQSFSPDTRLHFDSGSRSRTIDLPGTLRDIRRIDFYYRSVPGSGEGRATLRVFGRE